MGVFEEEKLFASSQSLSFSNISLTSWDANCVDPIVSKQGLVGSSYLKAIRVTLPSQE